MLPFLSRATHDREVAALERLLAMAENARENAHQAAVDAMRLHELERRRYDSLLQQFMALKVQGAVVVPVSGGIVEPANVPTEKPEVLALKSFIAEKAGTNYALRGAMLRQLAQDIAEGVAYEQIEERILRGVESEGAPV